MGKSILVVCTSHSKLGDTDELTGLWADELAAPYYIFKAAGFDVKIASIAGGEIPMDEASLGPPFLTSDVKKFLLDDAVIDVVLESTPISDVSAGDYDAIYLPGGHGTCWDFPENQQLISLVEAFVKDEKLISSVCHGPGGLVNVKGPDGHYLVKDRKVTGFSNQEEYAVAKEKLVPFLLEDKLKERGGIYSAGDKWAVYTQQDGRLITGQNPQSSAAVAELVVAALGGATAVDEAAA